MIVVLEQLAGLGIRDHLARLLVWAGTSIVAAVLAVASVAAALVPYFMLLIFALWRLTPR